MSSCERIRPDLVAADRDELTPAEAAAVRDHVAACAPCAAEARKLRRAADLVARATDVAPPAVASARIRRSVDAALAASRAPAPVHDLAAARRSRGFLRDAWDYARWRYEESAAVRRFTLASIGVHAAAAAVLVAILATSPGRATRDVEIRWEPGETAQLPDGTGTGPVLPAFDAMTPDGVESPLAPGRRFPNRTTADRWSAAMTIEGRRAAFRMAFGDDAELAAGSLDRGLDWLAAQRGADGVWDAGGDPVESTAAAVLAFAGAGRTSAEVPTLGASVDWLALRAADAPEIEDRALAARAVAAQFVADFGRLPRDARTARAGSVAVAARAVASTQNGDGGFGPRPGAPSDVASTVAAVAALADARAAGVVDTSESLGSAARWIEVRRSPDGRLARTRGGDPVVLTSALAACAADAGVRPLAESALVSLSARVPGLGATPRDAAVGIEALAASARPTGEAARVVLAAQRADGRWSAPRRAGAAPRDVADTAWGVVALTRVLRR